MDGSSNCKTLGLDMRPRPKASICCSPPLNVPPSWFFRAKQRSEGPDYRRIPLNEIDDIRCTQYHYKADGYEAINRTHGQPAKDQLDEHCLSWTLDKVEGVRRNGKVDAFLFLSHTLIKLSSVEGKFSVFDNDF